MLKCETCSVQNDATIRTIMGCGWLPASEGSSPWTHRGDDHEYETCPGYSTVLPDVIDIARMHRHWSKGALQVRGEARSVEDGIEIFESSVGQRDSFLMNDKDGG